MKKICLSCNLEFEVTDDDLKFYEKVGPVFNGKKYPVAVPTHCPDCRQRRRLAYRNERNFYHRKCDLSGKQIISTYAPDTPYKIYDHDEWWSDKWDPLSFGRDFDFSRTFFEQYDALSTITPRLGLVVMYSENSKYTNHSAYNKNCYMCMNSGYCEDMLYSSNYNLYDKNCVDCLAIQNCELCYFCTDCRQCSFSNYLYQCKNCSDCIFCYDCQSCVKCFGCYNLRHKQFCIYNKQFSEVEYGEKLKEIMPKTWNDFKKTYQNFWKWTQEGAIFEALKGERCENSTGDHLENCKNTFDAYYTFDTQDSRFCFDCGGMKDGYDVYEPFKGELQYETHACNLDYGAIVCSKCYENNNIFYCQYCWNSENLFGCFGLKKKKYCILNKQYTREEYEVLVPRIIEHMMKTKEWGEFFPMKDSGFAYNETVAIDYYLKTKEEILKEGLKWRDLNPEKLYRGPEVQIPENISDVDEEICKKILICEVSGKPYKIIPQELNFYKKMNLPVPKISPDERHKMRMGLRNPRHLWQRSCSNCGEKLQSSYSPDIPERKIYCQKCYLSAVY